MKLKEEFKRHQRELSIEANSEIGDRYSHYFSVVKLAADLVCRILGIGDPVNAEESIYRVFSSVVKESLTDVDISTRSMKFIISWATGHESLFKVNAREAVGVWRAGEYIGIYPHKLTELLRKEGYPDKASLRGWSEKNWIAREDKHFTCLKRMKTEDGISKMRRFVVVPWSVVEKILAE